MSKIDIPKPKTTPKSDTLKVNDHDPSEIQDLKNSYNFNSELITYLSQFIREQMDDYRQPEKYLLDAVEKYQKANVLLIKTLKAFVPAEDELQKAIDARLKGFNQ
jgi:hypothetical protein